MREHFKYISVLLLAAAVLLSNGIRTLAETKTAVDTIVMNTDIIGDEEVPTDYSWKTKQDKGQWLSELKVAEDIDSLILVINNLDKEDPYELPRQEDEQQTPFGDTKEESEEEKDDITGKSRFSYYTRHGEDGWHEIFSVDCFISGDDESGNEAVYGVYYPDSSFGIKSNPGSLLPYQLLTNLDYWVPNPESDDFGTICTVPSIAERPRGGIRLKKLKTLCNYSLILRAEKEDAGYPALVLNCLKNDKADDTFCGIQLSETYVRMLVQSIDENTRIVVTNGYENLSEMGV